MEQLTSTDTQKLLKAIESLYSIQNLDTFGRDTLAILAKLVPTEASIIVSQKFDNTDVVFQSLCLDFERLIKDLEPALYRYAHQNPIYQNLPLTLKGAHKMSDFVSREAFQCWDAYHEVMKPIGFEDTIWLSIYRGDDRQMPCPDEQTRFYTLYHPWQKFTECDRLLLNFLQPHLIQAYENVNCWQQLQQQLTQLQQSLDRAGIVFLDSYGQVQLLTSQAGTWLRSYFPTHNSFSQLPEQLQSWVKHQLSQLKAKHNLPAPRLPLCVQQGERKLIVRLVIDQLGARYFLLLAEERVIPLLSTLELLGLTQREAEVLLGIIQGKDNKAIALELSIHVSTARKHLENIYRKLGVQSRTEAIAQTLAKLGILNSPHLET